MNATRNKFSPEFATARHGWWMSTEGTTRRRGRRWRRSLGNGLHRCSSRGPGYFHPLDNLVNSIFYSAKEARTHKKGAHS